MTPSDWIKAASLAFAVATNFVAIVVIAANLRSEVKQNTAEVRAQSSALQSLAASQQRTAEIQATTTAVIIELDKRMTRTENRLDAFYGGGRP